MSNDHYLMFTDSNGIDHEIQQMDKPCKETFEFINNFIMSLEEGIRKNVTFISEWSSSYHGFGRHRSVDSNLIYILDAFNIFEANYIWKRK